MAGRTAVERTRGDVIEQRTLDRRGSHALLTARMRSTLEALAQDDEPYAQRQALIDLAAVCQRLAAGYRRPTRQPKPKPVNGNGNGSSPFSQAA